MFDTSLYIYMYVCMYVCVCMFVCVCVCVCVHPYAEQDAKLRFHFLDEPIRRVSYTTLLLCWAGLLHLWNVNFYV